MPRDADIPPTSRELTRMLGESHAAFVALTDRGKGVTREWRRYKAGSPWVMKVTAGKRTLLYAKPQDGVFEATVLLGPKAAEAALAGRVTKKLHTAIREARPYAEGRPVRVMVKRDADVAAVEQLIAVKLNPDGR